MCETYGKSALSRDPTMPQMHFNELLVGSSMRQNTTKMLVALELCEKGDLINVLEVNGSLGTKPQLLKYLFL